MRIRFFTLLLIVFCLGQLGVTLRAQPIEYRFGVGIKLGSPVAVSAKYMVAEHHAVELLAGGWFYAGGATLLYEYHLYMRNAPSLRWYLGVGAHCAYAAKNSYNPYSDRGAESRVYAGLDGVLGLEYVFPSVPFAVALDALPTVNFSQGVSLWWNAGIVFRYTFR